MTVTRAFVGFLLPELEDRRHEERIHHGYRGQGAVSRQAPVWRGTRESLFLYHAQGARKPRPRLSGVAPAADGFIPEQAHRGHTHVHHHSHRHL
jgi:hypothetical protein